MPWLARYRVFREVRRKQAADAIQKSTHKSFQLSLFQNSSNKESSNKEKVNEAKSNQKAIRSLPSF
jgi:hypothetical protein